MFEKIKKRCNESKKFKRDTIMTILAAIVLTIVILNHIFLDDNMYVIIGGVVACAFFYAWLGQILFKSMMEENAKRKKDKDDQKK